MTMDPEPLTEGIPLPVERSRTVAKAKGQEPRAVATSGEQVIV